MGMNIGTTIREQREILGWSQARLGFRAGYAPHTVSAIERGDRLGGYQTVVDILNALGLDLTVVKL
jgi:transcriptional regulator with XRE-family HTH domain